MLYERAARDATITGKAKPDTIRQWTCQKSKKWQPGPRAARAAAVNQLSRTSSASTRGARHEAVLVPGLLPLTRSGQPREAGRSRTKAGPGRPPAAATSVAAARTKPGPVAPAPPGDGALPRRGCPAGPGYRDTAPLRAPAGRHPTERGTRGRQGTKRGQAAEPARCSGPGPRHGKSPCGRVLTGLRRSGCPGVQGRRGAESGPARSGRAAAAAPARAPTPPPSARRRRPRAADPPPPAPGLPPAGHANARLSPSVGAPAAAARDPARPGDGNEKPHPAGRQCAAAAPLGGAAPPACSPPLPAGVRARAALGAAAMGLLELQQQRFSEKTRPLRKRVAVRRAGLACQ